MAAGLGRGKGDPEERSRRSPAVRTPPSTTPFVPITTKIKQHCARTFSGPLASLGLRWDTPPIEPRKLRLDHNHSEIYRRTE